MIDVIILVILLIMVGIGYYRGFVWQVLRLARILLLLIVLYVFGNYIVAFFLPIINPWVESTFLSSIPVAFRSQIATLIIRLFFPVVFYIVASFITKKMLKLFHGKAIKKIPLVGILNSLLGSVVAFIEFSIIFLLLVALMPVAGTELNMYMVEHSYIIRFVQEQIPAIIKIIQMYWS